MNRGVLALSLLIPLTALADGPRKLGCSFSLNIPHAKAVPEKPMTPEALHKFVQKGNGMGGLRCPQFFKAVAGAKFYRLWDGRPDKAVQAGRSFTLERYPPHDAQYRKKFAVCESWNDLSKEWVCEIKPGATAIFAVGPGEQVGQDTCGRKGEFYREAADLQVMLVSDPRAVCR